MFTRFKFFFFTLKDCFFGGVKSAKNFDLDKYVCSGYGIGFESHSEFFFPNGNVGNHWSCYELICVY